MFVVDAGAERVLAPQPFVLLVSQTDPGPVQAAFFVVIVADEPGFKEHGVGYTLIVAGLHAAMASEEGVKDTSALSFDGQLVVIFITGAFSFFVVVHDGSGGCSIPMRNCCSCWVFISVRAHAIL